MWTDLARKVLDILLPGEKRRSPGSTSSSPGRKSGGRGSARPNSRARADRTSAYQDPVVPGRDGGADSITRDLTLAEKQSLRFEYAPNRDGDPDPGEVVWTWVPYAENDGRGKDRPVLILGRVSHTALAGCYLSTKQHRDFIPVGTGGWDPQHRPSFLSPERLLRVTHAGMRREGHEVDRETFIAAATAVARTHHLRG
ncbi:hypothetical protein FW756_03925 [Leucobacter sp. 1207-22]